eukprot:jgi/Tetstr1/427700/TSEL_017825.t1
MADAASAFTKALAAAGATLDAEVVEYVGGIAESVLEEAEGGVAETAEELAEQVGPMLEEALSEEAVSALCLEVVALLRGGGEPAAGGDGGEGGAAPAGAQDDSQDDFLVNCENIIMAFAGRVLLKKSDLKLRRGHKYGLVGQNGVGKSTLLGRIAQKDINGFPAGIKCVFVQHEILVVVQQSVTAYLEEQTENMGVGTALVSEALSKVGFTDATKGQLVSELSGGWRMRLAIAKAILENAELLMLDEPTNHLDVGAVAWLTDYLREQDTTMVIVSHDYNFLSDVATDIIFFEKGTLGYYGGGFDAFQEQQPQTVMSDVQVLLTSTLNFPDPGSLEGVKGRNKPVLRMTGASFTYPGAAAPQLAGVTCKLALNSRVAITGPNGAGKTTLLRVMVGDTEPDPGVGEVWKHQSLRIAYVAQHSMHHLEENLERTPLLYIQDRFYLGRDRELAKLQTLALTEEELECKKAVGMVDEVIGRAMKGGALQYELKKTGFSRKDETTWETIDLIKSNSRLYPPYVMKLVRNYDEKMKAMQSGLEVRPVTTAEVLRHLAEFGITEELARSSVRGMSAGQKSRLVLAAAMWAKPHLVALDEPTNYIDNETLNVLVHALRGFKGGLVCITHNEAFVSQVCNETWTVSGRPASVSCSEPAGRRRDAAHAAS